MLWTKLRTHMKLRLLAPPCLHWLRLLPLSGGFRRHPWGQGQGHGKPRPVGKSESPNSQLMNKSFDPIESHGSMLFRELGIPWHTNGILWNIMEYYGISWNIMEYYGILWNIMEWPKASKASAAQLWGYHERPMLRGIGWAIFGLG